MPLAADGSATPLRLQLGALWRRKWTVLAVAVVAVALAAAYSAHKTPLYQSTAAVRLTPQLPSAVLSEENSSVDSFAATVDVPTAIQVIQSSTVANQVANTVPHPPPVSASQVGTTDVVQLTVRSSVAKIAAQTANAYARAYLRIEKSGAKAGVSAAVRQLQLQVASDLRTTMTLQRRLATAPAGRQSTNLSGVLSSAQQTTLADQTQLAQYKTALALTSGGGVLISPAVPPTSAVVPKPAEYIAAALIVGLILGGALVLLLDRLDTRVRSRETTELVLGDIALVGAVPRMRIRGRRPSDSLVTLRSPYSSGSESYRLIRPAVDHMRSSRSLTVIQVTSPRPGDGKTITAANLAVVFAQSGVNTVLVDCNLRRPQLHDVFALSKTSGFTTAALDPSRLAEVLCVFDDVPNLRVLPAGPLAARPDELLGSDGARAVFGALRGTAELVIVDSSPVLTGADASVTAWLTDATLLVAAAARSTRQDVLAAIEGLNHVGVRPLAAVLNYSERRDTGVRSGARRPDSPAGPAGTGAESQQILLR
jgi:succinoglycan biosynthesis transport protein ExoP